MTKSLAITAFVLASLLCACTQKMGEEGHLRPLGGERSQSLTTRMAPAGTVAQDEPPPQAAAAPQNLPIPLTRPLLERGRQQYEIFCMPCHGMSGQGDGMIVQRGFLAPPSYHMDRLRNAPDGHFYDVITNGYGAMYSYGDRVRENDRWAIIAYIRALQLSQNTRAGSLNPEDSGNLPPKPATNPNQEQHP